MAGHGGGLSVYTTLIPNESTPFRLERHEQGARGPFVTVHLGDGYQVIHLREVATADRLLTVLAKARDWLATQQPTDAEAPRELTRS